MRTGCGIEWENLTRSSDEFKKSLEKNRNGIYNLIFDEFEFRWCRCVCLHLFAAEKMQSLYLHLSISVASKIKLAGGLYSHRILVSNGSALLLINNSDDKQRQQRRGWSHRKWNTGCRVVFQRWLLFEQLHVNVTVNQQLQWWSWHDEIQ